MDEVRVRGAVPFRLAFVLTLLATAACTPPDPPLVVQSGVNAAAVDRLIERIDALVAALGHVPATAASAATAPAQAGERTRVADDSIALLARIEMLEHTIAALQTRGPTIPAGVTPRHAVGPMRQDVVGQMQAQFADKAQRENARRSLFMLTPHEVLERLGMPASTYLDGHTLWWRYSFDKNEMSIGFLDGAVMFVG